MNALRDFAKRLAPSFERRNIRDVLVVLIGVAIAWLLLARLQGFFLREPSPVAFDDGYTIALGERIIDGAWLPYVDGFSHRGPLLYWMAALAQKLSGRFNWLGPRWLSIVLTFAAMLGAFVAGAAARKPISGAIAALIYVFVLSIYDVGAAFGILGETVASPFAIWALAFTAIGILRAQRPGVRCAWLVLGGISAGLSGLAKQTALFTIVPLLVWSAFAFLPDARLELKRRLWLASSGLLGFGLVVVVVVVRYASAGALGQFYYWFYAYNVDVYMQPYRATPFRAEFDGLFVREYWILLALALTVVASLAGRLAAVGRSQFARALGASTGGFELSLALLAICLFVSASAPMRFWPHYYVALIPVAALLAGIGVERALGPASAPFGLLARLFAVAAVALLAAYASDIRLKELRLARANGGWASPEPEPICDYLAARSAPGASTFIWGFDGDLYVTCKRPPASRFLYLTLVAGTIPGLWNDVRADRVARGAREDL